MEFTTYFSKEKKKSINLIDVDDECRLIHGNSGFHKTLAVLNIIGKRPSQ
jgi:hypothetical protein